jgi:chemotaxis regulatin CheY-phosphate phosphatase CheZ
VSPHWATIDGLVRDLGDVSSQVHLAERTLGSDPRTAAARRALEQATDAVCTAIDETSASAAERAATAIEDTRALLGQLGVTVRASRTLVTAAHDLIARAEAEHKRMALLRRRLRKMRRPN